MSTPLLLIGTGFDGPVGEPVTVTSIEEAYEVFGGYAYEYLNLGPATTHAQLSQIPAADITTYVEDDGELAPYRLFSFSASAADLTFEAPGETVTIICKYLRATSGTELFRGYAEALAGADVPVTLMRVGGETAAASVACGESTIELTASSAGSLYNSTDIRVATAADGGKWLQITPPAGKGFARRYRLGATTALGIVDAINTDFMKGYGVTQAVLSGPDSVIDPEDIGATALSGGSDGDYSDEELAMLVDSADLSGVKVASILGKTYDDLKEILTKDILDSLASPTMFVQGAGQQPGITSAAYTTRLVSLQTASHWMISIVVGVGLYEYGVVPSYWSSLAPAYASVLAATSGTITRKSVGVADIGPVFTESDLQILASSGYVAFTKSVGKGFVVYDGVTTNTAVRTTHYITYSATVSKLQPILEPIVGRNTVDKKDLERRIHDALSSIPTLRDFSFTVACRPGRISVDIVLYIVGELREIKFSVGVKSNATLS